MLVKNFEKQTLVQKKCYLIKCAFILKFIWHLKV